MAKKRAYTSTYEENTTDLVQLYDKSFENLVDPEVGKEYSGRVIALATDYASVDIGARQEAYILLKDESESSCLALVPGNKIKLTVTELNNSSRNVFGIVASIDSSMKKIKYQEIIDSIGNKTTAFNVYVESLVSDAGYIVKLDEFKAFMPGSLASMNLLANFSDLVGKTIPVMVVNYTKETDTLVVSHKEYLSQLIPNEISQLEKDKWYSGKITGLSDFGIFVEFNDCLTGLIYKTDIAESTKQDYESKMLRIGNPIEFKIKDIVNNKRLILTQTDTYDPWSEVDTKYQRNGTYKAKLLKKKDFGTFFELEPGLNGLSLEQFTEPVGTLIDVRIDKIDKTKRKINLYKVF